MDIAENVFLVPFILRVICYTSAMALIAASVFWLAQHALGRPGRLSLQEITTLWLVRVLAACSFLSLGEMMVSGRMGAHPAQALPEIAILLLLLASFMLHHLRGLSPSRAHTLVRLLPIEIGKVFAVGGIALASVLFSIMALRLLTQMFPAPDWLAIFVLGGLFMLVLVTLFFVAEKRSPTPPRLKPLLWPAVFACLLLMLPDALQDLGNSPKVQEMLYAKPRLSRA